MAAMVVNLIIWRPHRRRPHDDDDVLSWRLFRSDPFRLLAHQHFGRTNRIHDWLLPYGHLVRRYQVIQGILDEWSFSRSHIQPGNMITTYATFEWLSDYSEKRMNRFQKYSSTTDN